MIDSTERLLAYRDRDFEYDLNGRLRAESYITPGSDDRIRCYTYDVLGALHRWEDRAGPAASGVTLTSVCASPFSTITDHAWAEYDLDATGRRIGRRAWTDTGGLDEERYWVYLDALNPIAQLDDEGRVTQLYVYGTHEHSPDAMITWDYGTCTGPSCTPTEAHHRFLRDIRGSVRMVYNTTTGAITQQLDYDEFGVVTTNTAPFAQPFGYAGGEYDHLTGLTRFGARDYDPTLGRWTAPDPIGFAGGDSNLYLYVGGRVVGFVDVTGEQSEPTSPPSGFCEWCAACYHRNTCGENMTESECEFRMNARCPDCWDICPPPKRRYAPPSPPLPNEEPLPERLPRVRPRRPPPPPVYASPSNSPVAPLVPDSCAGGV